ncbi:MAG: GDSL-type esterase/lipase family protein [Erysipelotrichaceae bacterium]|nr:GDSL-type esterase/lipase family protein [Erysipelotrichaceae bacterium]
MNDTIRILCYGDSNTYGYVPAGSGRRYGSTIRWPMKLQSLLGDSFTVIEEGLSGRTADLARNYESWKSGNAYLCASLSTHRPVDFLIIMLGTNDLKKDFMRDEKMIAETVSHLIRDAEEFFREKQGYIPEILLISPPHLSKAAPSGPFGSDFDIRSVQVSQKLAYEYQKIAEEHHILFLDSSLYAHVSETDGVHLDQENHLHFARAVCNVIRKWAEAHSEDHRKEHMQFIINQ